MSSSRAATSAGPHSSRAPRAWKQAWEGAAWRRAARRARRRDFLALGGILTAMAAGVLGFQHAGLRFQHTGSLPRGVYRDVPGTATRGVTAVWCLPESTARWARRQGYLNRGSCPGQVEPVGKVILATAGDTVDFAPEGLALNRAPVRRTALPTRDLRGRRTPHVPFGRHVLAPGEVWLWSPYTERSFDSRVFGPVPAAALVAVVEPIWTF